MHSSQKRLRWSHIISGTAMIPVNRSHTTNVMSQKDETVLPCPQRQERPAHCRTYLTVYPQSPPAVCRVRHALPQRLCTELAEKQSPRCRVGIFSKVLRPNVLIHRSSLATRICLYQTAESNGNSAPPLPWSVHVHAWITQDEEKAQDNVAKGSDVNLSRGRRHDISQD